MSRTVLLYGDSTFIMGMMSRWEDSSLGLHCNRRKAHGCKGMGVFVCC